MSLRPWALAATACATVFLAACSNPSSPPASTTTTSTTTTTAPPSTSSSTTTSSTSTSTTAASTACDHISASAGQSEGAAGTITGVVTITNTGPSTCTMNGYPTMALYSGSGAPLTVTMVNGLSVTLTPPANGPPSAVNVPPGRPAVFNYQYSDVPVGSETGCPASEIAAVTAPGATTASGTFPLAIQPCNNGTIRVSPVYAQS